MKLKVIGTGSTGNAYLLENGEEALLIECGVRMSKIKEAIGFNINKIVGCIVTHEHGDHAKSIKDVMDAGIDVYATAGTHGVTQSDSIYNNRAKYIKSQRNFMVGNFKIMPFDVLHDAAEPCGFLINHPETGNVLFMTDLIYSPYTFKNLHNIIIEANYDEMIAKRNLKDMEFLRNRVINNHMSLSTCRKFLFDNDLTAVNNIVLIHLSDGNSDEALFKKAIEADTGKNVTVADNGLIMELNKTPF